MQKTKKASGKKQKIIAHVGEKQVENALQSFSRLYAKRLSAAGKKMIHFSATEFIASRNERVADLQSKDAKRAMDIEEEMYPLGVPKIMLCVDGRVIAKLVASAHGGAIRTPAADNAEFLPLTNGDELFLIDGNIANEIRKQFQLTDSIAWVLDSHLHCAAQKASIIDTRGTVREDDGLYEDVVRKKKIAFSLERFVQQKFGQEKTIHPIQVSFDPHEGYLYMGLEQDAVLRDPRVLESGFTESVLEEISKEGKILSTKEWSTEGGMLHSVFLKNFFEINYESNYRKSTALFWNNMKEFARVLIPLVQKQVLIVYPNLAQNKDLLVERSVFLLANAYTAFLYNASKGGYVYGEHDESIIAVTYGDRGPYNRMRSFTVDPNNPNISFVIKFVENLIRSNRSAGRMSRCEKDEMGALYGKNVSDYVWSPVPIAFFEHLTTSLSDDMTSKLQKADWSDLPEKNWMDMETEDFFRYLDSKIPGFPAVAAHRIDILRSHAKRTYAPGLSATSDFLEGRLFPLWMLRDVDRRILAVFPFFAKGYRNE